MAAVAWHSGNAWKKREQKENIFCATKLVCLPGPASAVPVGMQYIDRECYVKLQCQYLLYQFYNNPYITVHNIGLNPLPQVKLVKTLNLRIFDVCF